VGELKFPNNFTVDCGDFFGVGGEQDSLKSVFLVHAMDKLGYDVVTLGERELNFGQQFLLSQFKTTKVDVVCANLVYADSKKPFVKPYVIRKVGTLKVAFFGLMGKDMKIRPFKGDPALTILDPTETGKAMLADLRKKADVVVLLSHLGMSDSQKLTVDVPVDVMFFGHQPGLFKTLAKTQDVITVRGGERGQYIPEVHLVIEDKKITSFDGDVVQLEHRFINLAAVPQADNESFDTIAPGRWLLDHVPWSEAEHTIRAESADARIARLMHVERGAACLVIERRTWQGRKAITLARLVHPGARHALTGRFRPAGVTGR